MRAEASPLGLWGGALCLVFFQWPQLRAVCVHGSLQRLVLSVHPLQHPTVQTLAALVTLLSSVRPLKPRLPMSQSESPLSQPHHGYIAFAAHGAPHLLSSVRVTVLQFAVRCLDSLYFLKSCLRAEHKPAPGTSPLLEAQQILVLHKCALVKSRRSWNYLTVRRRRAVTNTDHVRW